MLELLEMSDFAKLYRRRDAFILGSYLILLFGTTSLVPQLWFWVASWSNPWLKFIPEGVGFLLTALVLRRLIVQRSSRFFLQLLTLTPTAIFFFVSMNRIRLTIEQIHFSEYGFLTFLVFRFLRHLDPSRRTYVWTLAAVSLIGVLDELLQGLLPNRVYDPRDIAFNALAGVLGLSTVILLFDPLFLR